MQHRAAPALDWDPASAFHTLNGAHGSLTPCDHSRIWFCRLVVVDPAIRVPQRARLRHRLVEGGSPVDLTIMIDGRCYLLDRCCVMAFPFRDLGARPNWLGLHQEHYPPPTDKKGLLQHLWTRGDPKAFQDHVCGHDGRAAGPADSIETFGSDRLGFDERGPHRQASRRGVIKRSLR